MILKAGKIIDLRRAGKTVMMLKHSSRQDAAHLIFTCWSSICFYSPFVFGDEIQKAPEPLLYIKEIFDAFVRPDHFWLTDSWSFHLMKEVSETQAGSFE